MLEKVLKHFVRHEFSLSFVRVLSLNIHGKNTYFDPLLYAALMDSRPKGCFFIGIVDRALKIANSRKHVENASFSHSHVAGYVL